MENETDPKLTVIKITAAAVILDSPAQEGVAVTEFKIKAPLPVEKRTVFGPSGRGDLAFISDAMAVEIGCKVGTVKLLKGVEGRNGGYGEAHIEAKESRGKHLEGLGHRTVFAYVSYIAGGFQAIGLQNDGRIVLIRREGTYSHQCFCQWDEDLEIWSVTTAIPFRRERNMNIKWGTADWN